MSFDNNEVMIELFRSEVQSHAESLTQSLLALERDPTLVDELDGMMRSAHSIKGAARIMEIGPAVDVAHIIEECFVAAQKGEVTLDSGHVDCLLNGVDVLSRISQATKDLSTDWNDFQSDVQTVVRNISRILGRTPPERSSSSGAGKAEVKESTDQTPIQQPPIQELATPDISSTVPEPAAPAPTALMMPAKCDRDASERVRLELMRRIDSGSTAIQIDLSGVQQIEPIVLALLTAAAKHVEQIGMKSLVLLNPSSDLHAVLRVTGLAKLVHPSSRG